MDRRAAPRFEIGSGFAVYRGPIGAGSAHRHAAFQIAIGTRHRVVVLDGSGYRHQSSVLVIAPMVEHCLQAAVDVTTYFVDPQCTLADALRHHHSAEVSAAPELRKLLVDGIPDPCRRPSTELDPRLVEALSALSDNNMPLLAVAAQVGLSAQRLRALARRDLGMPLTRWRVRTRLRRAAQAVQDGQSLADAAVTAGFSDQAHLTRQMREMMGLTPGTVLPLLRHHFLHAT